jgi:hypothetical protein
MAVTVSSLPFASVTSLLGACRPPTVIRRVRAVIVDSVNRVVGTRSRSHVGIEDCEVFLPLVAHRDSASAVVRVTVMSRVATAGFRFSPRPGFGNVVEAMLAFGQRGQCASKTATTAGCSAAEVSAIDHLGFSAIANASPEHAVVTVVGSRSAFDDDESAVTISCEVDERPRHPFNSNGSSDGRRCI